MLDGCKQVTDEGLSIMDNSSRAAKYKELHGKKMIINAAGTGVFNRRDYLNIEVIYNNVDAYTILKGMHLTMLTLIGLKILKLSVIFNSINS